MIDISTHNTPQLYLSVNREPGNKKKVHVVLTSKQNKAVASAINSL